MGKNKTEKLNVSGEKGKTQELEKIKRIPMGYHKNNPTKPK
jgi:hypothetical protein